MSTSRGMMSRTHRVAYAAVLLQLTLFAPWALAQSTVSKDAEPTVRAATAAVRKELPFADRADYEDAKRGFLATLPDAVVTAAGGRTVWSLKEYGFLQKDDSPATVNPSLWRLAQLNLQHGLFKVVDGVYQVRGLDIANMTIVEAKTGLILIDTLLTAETAKAGLDLYYAHRPRRPVVAVIYSHSHVDHWGGVKGVISEADVQAGNVVVIAPAGFMEAAVSENVIAGNAMSRRAHYQFGHLLPKGERGQVDTGLGKTVPRGSITLIAPTDVVAKDVDRRVLDGVEIAFQLAPGSEAPAEFHMYFPQFKMLNLAENATHTFHNLLAFRGGEVRDPLAWSRYINEALAQFGGEAEVLLGQHHWPVWGRERLQSHLRKQRDLYKYVHDQTVRLMNQGYTATEIAEMLQVPASLAGDWHLRGYYGAVSHNVKAIYQRYLGWYDANPANLNPLPPSKSGKKFVEYMGGPAAVIARAREDFKQGNYRWVAQVMSQVVFADPANREARELAADALEQLGYLAEAATWRNAYLMGAWELRYGLPQVPAGSPATPDTLKALKTGMFFDYLGVGLDGPKAGGKKIVVNWNFTDKKETYVLNLENAALTYLADRQASDADATLTLTRATLDSIILRQTTFPQAIQSGQIRVEGDASKVTELLGLIDNTPRMFEIIEPKRP
jgi:alkyl sulfatase BDS1-like metallo-beta-lactamase superfamily hydrolase